MHFRQTQAFPVVTPVSMCARQVYTFEEVLGRGAFGEVVRSIHQATGRKFAIKKLATSTLRSGDLKREVTILRECRHPNIISLRECFATEEFVYLVMELATGGALIDVVTRLGLLSESFAAAVTMQMASAIAYMHYKGIVHRDLKPENVLLASDETKIIKVCDFGLSKIFMSGADKASADTEGPLQIEKAQFGSAEREMVMRSQVGTTWYAAPELLRGDVSYDHSIDMWGLGLIVYILVSGRHPFDHEDMYGAVTRGEIFFAEPAWQQVSPSAADLVRELLRPGPTERLSADAVLKHQWMQDGISRGDPLAASLAYLRDFQTRETRASAFKALANALSDNELAAVHEIFDLLDVDSKGYLTTEDIAVALNHKAHRLLGRDTTQAKLPRNVGRYNLPQMLNLLAERAISKACVVTFDMFVDALLAMDDELVRRRLMSVFEAIDVGRKGMLTPRSVHSVLDTFALSADGLYETQTILREAKSGDSELEYSAFVDVLLRERRATDVANVCEGRSLLRDPSRQHSRNVSRSSTSMRQNTQDVALRCSSGRASGSPPTHSALTPPDDASDLASRTLAC